MLILLFTNVKHYYEPDESLSTCSSLSTHNEARASHTVGVSKHTEGAFCSSERYVKSSIFSAMALLVTNVHCSDIFPLNKK